MAVHPSAKKPSEKGMPACYFFHGEDTYQAEERVAKLKASLLSADDQGLNLERFNLEESSWMDVIDLARTAPFIFSSWRIVVARSTVNALDELSAADRKILADYFRSPAPRTVIVVIIAGKMDRSHSLLKFFSSLPPSLVEVKAMKPLKGAYLRSWAVQRFAGMGMKILPPAAARLEEVIGNDLYKLAGEVDKLVVFAGERRVIDEEDVNQVCDWNRTFVKWELTNALEKGDLKECLVVLNWLSQEVDPEPEQIFGTVAALFRDLLMARAWLRERAKDKKEIFRELRPKIPEKFKVLYEEKFRILFTLVEEIPEKDLRRLLIRLREIDIKAKTSDSTHWDLLESFIFEYCALRKAKSRAILSRERR